VVSSANARLSFERASTVDIGPTSKIAPAHCPSARSRDNLVAMHRSKLAAAPVALTILLLGRHAAAQETTLPVTEIYGSESTASPAPQEATGAFPRARGGFTFLTGGFGFASYGVGGGIGIAALFGVQATRLVGAYIRLRAHSLLLTNEGDMSALVDFTLLDRLQIGLGIGIMGVATVGIFGGGSSGSAITFPFYFGVTAALWRRPDGMRHGFQVLLDVDPGVSLGYNIGIAGFASLGLGWAWY
jgi:hypothetical protein